VRKREWVSELTLSRTTCNSGGEKEREREREIDNGKNIMRDELHDTLLPQCVLEWSRGASS